MEAKKDPADEKEEGQKEEAKKEIADGKKSQTSTEAKKEIADDKNTQKFPEWLAKRKFEEDTDDESDQKGGTEKAPVDEKEIRIYHDLLMEK